MGKLNEKLNERSDKFRLNIRDVAKSTLTGALTAGVAAIYQIVETQQINGEMTVTTAVLSIVAYLLKNLLENKNGEIVK